tara:strand:- start:803 stop:967 length:165 start_codon:yes stop_codon:yes gene_type:complete
MVVPGVAAFCFPWYSCCWRFSMRREMGNVGNYGKWENGRRTPPCCPRGARQPAS